MKRKRNNEPSKKQKKRKSIQYSSSPDKPEYERTLFDFWKPARKDNKSGNNKSKSKEKIFNEKNQLKSNGSNNRFNLIKNPSKQHLQPQVNNIHKVHDYKKTILFNDDFIENLKSILEPFVFEMRNVYSNGNLFHFRENIFNTEIFDKYSEENLFYIYSKFILHLGDNFLFIPKSFAGESPEKEKMKLIEGFNDVKKIFLQYSPLTMKEVRNKITTSYLI
jgi:hypothetical protein